MATDPETPLGHSTPSHHVLGWCSHCPGRSVSEELAAWQIDALNRALSRADEMEQLRTKNERMRHELEVMYGGAFDTSPTTTVRTEAQPEAPEVPYLLGRVAGLEAALGRVNGLATRLEEFAENALRVDDRDLYTAIAKDLRARSAVEGTV